MIKVQCPRCKKVHEFKELNLLHNDLAFWCCPDKKCRYIAGHTKELPKLIKDDKPK